eukprot:COSAG02_NODE_301_length_25237_cov_19.918490_18_plen_65_part_00
MVNGNTEQAMKGTDFEDLKELKLSAAFLDKQTRSKVKGKKLPVHVMECICRAMNGCKATFASAL